MIASGPNQDRDRFILLTTTDCDHCLLLKLDVSIVVDGVGQRAQTLLTGDAAEVCDRAFAQFDVFFVFSNADEIGGSGIAVVIASDTGKCTTLELVRSHCFVKILEQW